jgi:hypothetical protein
MGRDSQVAPFEVVIELSPMICSALKDEARDARNLVAGIFDDLAQPLAQDRSRSAEARHQTHPTSRGFD